MSRRTRTNDPESVRRRLVALLEDFEGQLKDGSLREQVRALVPGVHLLRDLGSSLVLGEGSDAARGRILIYLQEYPSTVVSGDELGVVSGISEYARRVRELRVEHGWPIYSGRTAKEMLEDEGEQGLSDLFGPGLPASDIRAMKADDYMLIGEQDRDAAHRWHTANDIRKAPGLGMKGRLLMYLREHVGKPVTGEELRYVANGGQSWPRRTRELRTEEGWPVSTRNSGRPDLDVGVYVLEADRQSQPHDRRIPDSVRVEVLERDHFRCRCCGWKASENRAEDPRALLELHHVRHHVMGGENEPDNLITLCNVHHDDVHRLKLNGSGELATWMRASCG